MFRNNIGYASFLDAPKVVAMRLEFRSYEQFFVPNANVTIWAYLTTVEHVGSRYDNFKESGWYLDIDNKRFIKPDGTELKATNLDEVFAKAVELVQQHLNK